MKNDNFCWPCSTINHIFADFLPQCNECFVKLKSEYTIQRIVSFKKNRGKVIRVKLTENTIQFDFFVKAVRSVKLRENAMSNFILSSLISRNFWEKVVRADCEISFIFFSWNHLLRHVKHLSHQYFKMGFFPKFVNFFALLFVKSNLEPWFYEVFVLFYQNLPKKQSNADNANLVK